MLIDYEEGAPTERVAPDVFVARGVAKKMRRTFLLWEEHQSPDVVFEIASPGIYQADLGWKRGLYPGLSLREYFLFDPSGEYLCPMFQGYRLISDLYQPIVAMSGERETRGMISAVIDLELWAKPGETQDTPFALRFYNPATKTWLPSPTEEANARRIAEARVAELQAEIERLRASGKQ